MAPYGDAGKVYVDWCAAMANSLDIGVPWIMCQQSDAPQPMVFLGFFCFSHFYVCIHLWDLSKKNYCDEINVWLTVNRSTHVMGGTVIHSHQTIPIVLKCGRRIGLAGLSSDSIFLFDYFRM